MKLFSPFLAGMALMLTLGFQTARAQSDSSPIENIGAGSRFVVGETPIVLPANEHFVYFQNGALAAPAEIDPSQPSCRLKVAKSTAARQLPPNRKLIVTGAWVRNSADNPGDYDILIFEHDKAIDQLQCTKGKETKDSATIGEIKTALGKLLTLVPAPPLKAAL